MRLNLLVIGRGLYMQRNFPSPDVQGRCSPPPDECPSDKQALFDDAFAILNTSDKISEEVSIGLRELGSALHAIGYNKTSVLLTIQTRTSAFDLEQLAFKGLPSGLYSPIKELVRLFSVGSPFDRSTLPDFLPKGAVAALFKLGVLVAWGDLFAPLFLYIQWRVVCFSLIVTIAPRAKVLSCRSGKIARH